MAKEPDDVAHLALRETLANLRRLSAKLDEIEARLREAEWRVDDLDMALGHSLGQSTEPPFPLSERGAGMDELFAQLAKINAGKKP